MVSQDPEVTEAHAELILKREALAREILERLPVLQGVDVSNHQSTWHPAGDEAFVFVLATEGTWFTSDQHDRQVSEARAAGAVIGHYHWLTGSIDPLAQAQYFLDKARPLPGDLLWCDFEDDWHQPKKYPHPTPSERWAFREQCKRLRPDLKEGLYCNRNDWTGTAVKAGDALWIAAPKVPSVELDDYPWTFHQYDWEQIDKNWASPRFDTVAALKTWAGAPEEEPVMAYPPGATDRIKWGDYQTTRRTKAMTLEARYLYKLRGRRNYPAWSQGGWSTSVGASAGTHGEDAFDDKLRLLSTDAARRAWERCLWEVGFAYWRRAAILGLWPIHGHGLPKGGMLSPEGDAQIVQWKRGKNALATGLDYPRILSSGLVDRTWEEYLDKRPDGTVDLSLTVKAFETGKAIPASAGANANDVRQIQQALNWYCGFSLAVDGVPGPATKERYAIFQARLFNVAKWSPDANGIPGKLSLQGLRFNVIT